MQRHNHPDLRSPWLASLCTEELYFQTILLGSTATSLSAMLMIRLSSSEWPMPACSLNYDDHVSDGFYDLLGEFGEVAPKKTFPTLDALRRVTLRQDDHREVGIFEACGLQSSNARCHGHLWGRRLCPSPLPLRHADCIRGNALAPASRALHPTASAAVILTGMSRFGQPPLIGWEASITAVAMFHSPMCTLMTFVLLLHHVTPCSSTCILCPLPDKFASHETIWSDDCPGWQVIVFDHDQDAKLCELDELAADAMAEAVSQGPQACVQVRLLLVPSSTLFLMVVAAQAVVDFAVQCL